MKRTTIRFTELSSGEKMNTDCLICNGRSESFAQAMILRRYEIEYFRCRDCQFIQTETPYWLEEAYEDAIVTMDVGLVSRNQRLARIADRVLRFVYPKATWCLDYGGGYGMFTRMMRDRGHRFLHTDPYCKNLFAQGLEADLRGSHFDLLTAFEVLEHLPNPHHDLSQLNEVAEHWLMTTEVVPDPAPMPGSWWYYVLNGGQHVSLWSQRALSEVASRYGRRLISHGGLHLFSRTKVNATWAKYILRDRSVRMLDGFRDRPSLQSEDFDRATATAAARATRKHAA